MLVTIRKATPRFVQSGSAPNDEAWQTIHAIADAHYLAMVQDFIVAVEAMQDRINQAELVQLLAQGPDAAWLRLAQVWDEGGRQVIEAQWAERFMPLLQEAAAAAQAGVVALVPPAFHVALSTMFNQVNASAVHVARTLAGQRITSISETTLEGVRAILTRAFEEGRMPDQVARTLARTVGLRSDQVNQLVNYENALAQGKLAPGRQRQLVRQFSRRLLRQRGELVARTEIQHTALAGQQALWEASEAQGFIPPGMRRHWLITPDDRLCPSCRQIPGLNPEGRGIREPFATPYGLVMHPGAHPACRCALTLRKVGS